MKVAAVQLPCSTEVPFNRDRLTAQIHTAANRGARLVVLQELHNYHYFCGELNADYFNLAETLPGPTTDWLGQLAKQLKLVIIGSIFECRAGGIYHNTAVVIEQDGSIAGYYRKMHIPHDPGFEEKYYFTPGDAKEDGFHPIPTSLGKLGVLVCWDQWYPEAARIMALRQADILIYPTAIGWNPEDSKTEKERQLNAWVTMQCSHAIANGLPLISCNRVGIETYRSGICTQFWGHSFIADSMGAIQVQSGEQADILIADITIGADQLTRTTWPFLRDRRIDAYGDIIRRYCD